MRREAKEREGSSLLLQERFESGDVRFTEELKAVRSGAGLRSLAERWYRDTRPAFRTALLSFIDDGCDRPHHRSLVKRLFKLAEEAGDDEALGHFLVAFDRLARRRLTPRSRWNWTSRQSYTELVFVSEHGIPSSRHEAGVVSRFSVRTRRYLVRRAFRYFRVLGRKDPGRFARAVRVLLVLYRDEHLTKPENLLDAWGLMHLLYRNSGVLTRRPKGIVLAPEHKLSELAPAPIYPELWRGCLDEILRLAESAASRTVRSWCLALLRRDYESEIRSLPLDRVLGLLRSAHPELQELGASLLETVPGLETVSVEGWLRLFQLESLLALTLLCERARKLLSAQQLSLAQCVELACARPAPVAELGFSWTREKASIESADLEVLCRLTAVEVPRVREEATTWLLELLQTSPVAQPEHLRQLIDARHVDVRRAAINIALTHGRFRDDFLLWSALAESPYPDVREALVRSLREVEERLSPDSLRHVWASTLLSIHGGGRAKRTAVRRIAEKVVRQPGQADRLLPLLRIALRSVRPAERRTALAAVSYAAFSNGTLRAMLEKAIPELSLFEETIA